MPKCIFCHEELGKNTKPEHIIQNALGGENLRPALIAQVATIVLAERSTTLSRSNSPIFATSFKRRRVTEDCLRPSRM
jgi:hypothetical protein